MKLHAIFLAALSAAGLMAGADVSSASAVYIMPMAGGLDQYLALRLTTGNVLQVVTDPQKADVVLTDRVGSGFEERWNELYPPPKVEKSDDKDKDTDKDKSSDKNKDKDKNKDDVFAVQRGASQPLARSRGAIFLIDRSTRNVLWSTYALPKSGESDEMDRNADRIAKELAKARKPAVAKK